MPSSAEDFLLTAQALLQQPGEAAARSAVSRAYYAAYHAALTFANSHGWPNCPYQMGVHEQLTQRFERQGQHYKALAIMLRNLRSARVKADYELAATLSPLDAQTHAQTAARLLDKLAAVPT